MSNLKIALRICSVERNLFQYMREIEQKNERGALDFSSEYSLQQGLKETQTPTLRNQISCLKLHCLNTFLKGLFENPNTGTENTVTAKLGNLACSI